MKKIFLLFFLSAPFIANAQWSTGGPNTTFSYLGNVGIGTASPNSKLHVVNSNSVILSLTGNTGGYVGSDLQITRTGSNPGVGQSPAIQFGDSQSTSGNIIQSYQGQLQFFTSSPNWMEAMRINTNGFLGIGTVSPQAQLDVNLNSQMGAGGPKFNTPLTLLKNGDANGTDNPVLLLKHTGVGLNQFSNPLTDKGIIRIEGFGTTTGYKAINSNDNFYVFTNGNVGINTDDTKGYKLAVNGSAIATSIKVKEFGNWPDFVFHKKHKLRTLTEVKKYIDKNSHLPEIPSAVEVKANGQDLGKMNRLLLKKVEELTLYLIQKDEQLKAQTENIKKQNLRIRKIEARLGTLNE